MAENDSGAWHSELQRQQEEIQRQQREAARKVAKFGTRTPDEGGWS
ncbi:hypothetical protein [Amycolatopsis rifamycinica]|nr:hypothetical protein [Amycolatopsis rifamycinica]